MAFLCALPHPVSAPRGLPLPRFGDIVDGLVRGGALVNLGSLAILLILRRLDLLTVNAVTLLPAAACLGMAGTSLGAALVCLRAMRAP